MEGSMEASGNIAFPLDFPCSLSEHTNSTQIQWCPSAAWSEMEYAFGWDGKSRRSIPPAASIRGRWGSFLPVGKGFSFSLVFVSVTGLLNMITAWACDSQCGALFWAHHAVTRWRIQPNAALKHWVHCSRCRYGKCIRAWCVCRKDRDASLEY